MMFQTGLNDQAIKEKDYKIDSLQKSYANAYKHQQDSSTTIIQNGIEDGNKKNYDAIATAFKEQGVKDSVIRAVMSNLKNSLKRPNVVYGVKVEPDFDFSAGESIKVEREGNEYKFTTGFQSKEAKTENITLKFYPVILTEKKGYQKTNTEEISDGLLKVGKDEILYSDFKVKVSTNDSIKVLFLVAKGSYWNSDQVKNSHYIF